MSATVGTTYKPWTISAVNPVWFLGWAQVEADPRETHLNHDASPLVRLAASHGGGGCQRHRGPRRRRLARPQHGRHRRQAPRRRQAAAVLAAPGRRAARGARPPHGAGRHVAVAGPWTVTTKKTAPPNGTVHDYASQAPYWWPNPNTADGCPYVQRDGVRNPEVDQYQDRLAVGRMFNSTYVLSLAWFYTGRDAYARHAADILRTWFLDPATAMNPNLDHAQIIPCANTGRAIGIIDFSQEYTNVLDAVARARAWNKRFLTWLTDSPFGKDEASQSNNHGTFANMQISALALFVGDKALARTTSLLARGFVDAQITSNGSQPQELARTRSWHYSNFNLGAHLRWALVARKVGVDVFGYKGPQGQSVLKAAGFEVPAAVGGAAAWPYDDIEFARFAATDNVRAAADAGLCAAREAVKGKKLQAPPGVTFLC
ncbi:hypothetical protein ACCO45_004839 [Purpureocillium lilacinum]|uniref:Uncharacterized protein n=1 Tax=Purpureocillium lilacinum TaxID=33203 RepID=A0ACC4DTQ3_PURLI